jgi:regulator of sigma E protease
VTAIVDRIVTWGPMALVAVFGFGLLIVVHELGHYLVARLFGMRVERFSVGFGPVLWSRRRGDTDWAISAVPLGGYVKIAGMAPGEEIAPGDPGAFCNQPAWRRFLVILAGPATNYAFALVLAIGLVATLGLWAPNPSPVVGEVLPGGAAMRGGLAPGDRVLSADGRPIDTWAALVEAVRGSPGRDLPLEVRRADAPEGAPPVRVVVRPDDAGGIGKLGMTPGLLPVRAGPVEAVVLGFHRTNQRAVAIVTDLGRVITGKQKGEMMGPVGIAQEMARSARAGAGPFLMLLWLISIMLAIFNFLPFPALDGGRLAFLGYEIVARRPANQKVESWIHAIGFVVLLALLLGVTVFGDLPRLLRR